MIESPEHYLAERFGGLQLEPALFYEWQNSIRFEISDPQIAYDNSAVMQQAFYRSKTLFNEVFEPEDDLFLVTDILTKSENNFLHKKPLNVYRKYIKDRQILNKLQLCESEDLEDEVKRYRFWLTCKKGDIRYPQLLQAICYEDFGHSSRILKSNPESGSNVYFINQSKNFVFHLYDDRGCDILAANKEAIRFLYEKHNEWILNYDRKEIDQLFK
ncbi:hypothetical protein A1A1_07844 [Planococcus antarcticus DSM 14505]|uniref:DUF3885 domain-containing protein n=1 Tax=Planococcus antarcticus DSM 14505 TaxID=1185653 RepID=A0AA87IM02_9BACL|nr:DUF3885 domain-containing protein [Planococcus antarcticus]EIM07071.1 hypothetical protein A1A1_07844 [Planococcus antarcticus DSM 14505]